MFFRKMTGNERYLTNIHEPGLIIVKVPVLTMEKERVFPRQR